jgi:hypothetical protein
MNANHDTSATNDDWLENALRAAGRDHRADYVADDGFTSRVVAQLPRRADAPAWRRPLMFTLWLLVGVAALLSLPSVFDQVFRNGVALLMGHRLGLIDVAAVLAMLSAATWGGLLYAARIE